VSTAFKYLKLTRGFRTKVDSDMFKYLNLFKWRTAIWNEKPYAVRTVKRKEVSMHDWMFCAVSSKRNFLIITYQNFIRWLAS